MLDPQDRSDYLGALSQAFDKFALTDDEVICIDTKQSGVMVNAIIVVRGKGITAQVVNLFHNFMRNLEKYKNKVKR